MSDQAPLLRVENLVTRFPTDGVRFESGERRAVNDVSFEIGRGEIVSLVGESGSGKSVSALSVLRLVDPPGEIAQGRVLFDGADVLKLRRTALQRLRGAGIGTIFQEPARSMNPVFTIGHQITETLREHRSLSRRATYERAVDWLARAGLDQPDRVMASYPHELSGGMLQRAMIAMALCCEPKLLIADEPTTALDVTIQAQIIDLLLDLRDETGLAILFITHDLGVVAQIADSVLVMYNGRIVERAETWSLFAEPKHPYTAALLATKPVLGQRQHRLPTISDEVRAYAALPPDEAARRPVVVVAPRAGRADAPGAESNGSRSGANGAVAEAEAPLVEVVDLVKHFGGRGGAEPVRAVNGVSLTVRPDEMIGLVGESGSGKTTFGQTILRMQEPTSGSVRFAGHDVFGLSSAALRRLRPQLQYIFQDPFGALNPRLQIVEAVGEPMLQHKLATPDDVRERVADVLELCGLGADSLERYPHEFSGGQRQRIVIARAMALEPDFVVADEPVSALDVSIQAQIINLFSDISERRRTAFLFISHDLGVVEHLCTRVAIMLRGNIVELATRDQLFDNPLHPYTRELLAAVPTPDPRSRSRHAVGRIARDDRPPAELVDAGDGHLVAG